MHGGGGCPGRNLTLSFLLVVRAQSDGPTYTYQLYIMLYLYNNKNNNDGQRERNGLYTYIHTYIIYIRLCVYISRICDVYTYNFCRGPLLLILLLGPVFARVWIWFTRAYPLHTLQCCRSTGRKTSEVRQYNSDIYMYNACYLFAA